MPGSTPTLRDMIQEAVDRGQTYEQLATSAIDERTGKRISRAQINNIVIGKADRMPYDYHLRALAAALKKPYEVVRQAAIRQFLPSEDSAADAAALLEKARRLAAEGERMKEESARLIQQLAERDPAPGEQDAPPHAETA